MQVSEQQRSLSSLIDVEAFSAYQILIIVLCALIAMLDGFDTQSIAFVAPTVAQAIGVQVSDFGPIFAAGLAGGLLGAIAFGFVADRRGRRLTLLTTLLLFGLCSLLTVSAGSKVQFVLFRFLTGLGLGGAMPSIIAMTAEYSPRRWRATAVTAMFCGFPLGAVVGAIASSKLIPAFGWKVVFISGGVLPLALFPLLFMVMPESIGWLAARGRSADIDRVLARMNRVHLWNRNNQPDGSAHHRARLAGLFEAGRASGTVLLWATFFLSLLLVYLLVSWIPTIAQQVGGGVQVGALGAAALNFGGIVGSLCFGRLIDRFGPFGVISAAYLGGAAVVAIIGIGLGLNSNIYWFAALTGFFCIGAQLCAVALASGFYPTEMRATGVGWAMGAGRVGAIAGPLIGGFLLRDLSVLRPLVVALAVISAAAALTVFGMGRVGRTLRSGS